MTMVMGGSSGVTFPDSTNLPASAVSAALSPAVTDTANVMTIQPNVVVAGTTGLTANGTTYTSATAFSPVNTVAPVVTGTAQVGQTLSCTTGTWTGIPTITYTYQWQFGTTNIPSATSSTYVISGTYVGQTIRCVVTATNPAGSTSANSNSTSAVTGAPFTLEYLVVAGGGGAGGFISGGGGAGGLRNASGLSLSTYVSYTVTVGAGGAVSTSGNDSVFASITSVGGGKGGTYEGTGSGAAGSGGSGGGGGGTSGTPSQSYPGGSGTGGQGNAGGTTPQIAIVGAAGGGGAGGPGTGSTDGNGRNGGNGASSTLSGTLAGGGGGGNRSYNSGTGGDGGSGGGGNGSGTNHLSSPGGLNTGGGGGGGGFGAWDYSPSAGGSGIVVIKFSSTLTATFSAGVTSSSSTAGGFTTVTITATSSISETVTFS